MKEPLDTNIDRSVCYTILTTYVSKVDEYEYVNWYLNVGLYESLTIVRPRYVFKKYACSHNNQQRR